MGSAIVMLIVALGSAHRSFTGAGCIGLTIAGMPELVDARLLPGVTGDDNNRLMACPNV
jgi:hypothetical protein